MAIPTRKTSGRRSQGARIMGKESKIFFEEEKGGRSAGSTQQKSGYALGNFRGSTTSYKALEEREKKKPKKRLCWKVAGGRLEGGGGNRTATMGLPVGVPT